ncbi:hypothetical protein F2A38_24035 [Pseudomonas chlororaphis]|uniref:Secreted protein n=1 Tax=Pseudomonas chlororaphis TaxID=587753 RepID=A0AB34C1H6_9PSED|nr:hypothetical protein F2A38_24035 [Pseudomonas chlororaphis]TWR97311.1 hypothetical protein FJD36_09645 [Pseudomonas chlororaphis subsp. chlororaphis]
MQRTKLHCRSLLIMVFSGRCRYRRVNKSGVAGCGSTSETRKSVWCRHQKPCGDRYMWAHMLITRAAQ